MLTSTNGQNKQTTFPATIPDKLQPFNQEAEEGCIGALLVDPDAIVKISNIALESSDFKIERLGWIYEAIVTLYNARTPADLVTLCDELERRDKLQKLGGPAYLTDLIHRTPSGLRAAYYARIVKRDSIYRQLIEASGKIARLAYNTDEGDPEVILQEAGNILLEVTTGNQTNLPQHISTYCQRVLDKLEVLERSPDMIAGLPTGVSDLDRILKGLKPGHLDLIAGRPGMGKSSLGLQIAVNAAKQYRKQVLFFNLEMTGEELAERIVSAESGIDNEILQYGPVQGDDYGKLLSALTATSKLSLTVDDVTRTIDAIRAKAILHHAKYGLDLVVLDYIQLVDTGQRYSNRDEKVGDIGKALKALAMELHIPVVAISSLSRNCESRHDKRPLLSDLRESGSLEYHANVVIMLYRDDVYNADSEFPNVAEIIIRKNRGGKTGVCSVYFKKCVTWFYPLGVDVTQLEPLEWQ